MPAILTGHNSSRKSNAMLILDENGACVWPDDLRPIEDQQEVKEPFTAWWARHSQALAHLEPRIAEQWVYRHWGQSPYDFLPIEGLQWRLETWPTQQILGSIFTRSEINAEWDYDVFNCHEAHGGIQHPGR
jgi:hypothetical protein